MHTSDYLKLNGINKEAATGLTYMQLLLANKNYINGNLNKHNNFEQNYHLGVTRSKSGIPIPYIYTTRGKLLYPKN